MFGDFVEKLQRVKYENGVIEIESVDGDVFRYEVDSGLADIIGYTFSKTFPRSRFAFWGDSWECGPPVHVDIRDVVSRTIETKDANGDVISRVEF